MPSSTSNLTSQCFALLCNRAQCGHGEDDGGLARRIARRSHPEESGPHAFEFAHADVRFGSEIYIQDGLVCFLGFVDVMP